MTNRLLSSQKRLLSSHIEILESHTYPCEPSWRWENPASRSKELNLWLVISGKGQIETPDGTQQIGPGDCFLFRRSSPLIATHDPEHPLIVPYAIFRQTNQHGKALKIPDSVLPKVHRKIPNFSAFTELMTRAIYAYNLSSRYHEVAVHWLKTCLCELLCEEQGEFKAELPSKHLGWIQETCQLMQQSPGTIESIEALAEHVGYSTDHFIRVFKKHIGMPPGEYWIRARMNSARSLLRSSTDTVSDIANLLGYRDACAFSSQFAARAGQSPSAYRKAYSST